MSTNRKILAASILAVVIVGVGIFSGADGPVENDRTDEVLGTTIFRPSTTEAPADADTDAFSEQAVPAPPASSVSLVASPPPPARSTRATAASSPPPTRRSSGAGTTATTSAPVPGRPAPGTQVVEKSDNGGSFTYRESAVSDVKTTDEREPGMVPFSLSGTVVDDHGQVVFKLVNRSGGDIGFPGGVNVKITIGRPDGTARTYEVKDPTITELQHDGSLEGKVDFGLEDDGTYTYTGEVLVEYR